MRWRRGYETFGLFVLGALAAGCSPDVGPNIEFGNQVADLSPDWSPDGDSIVFSSDRDGDTSLYLVDVDSGDVSRLTNGPFDLDPAWSPDGDLVVYVARESNAPTSIAALRVVTADGEPLAVEDSRTYEAFPDMNAAGEIVLACNLGTYDLCVRGLTMDTGGILLRDAAARDWQPAWSPDGDTVAFTSDSSGNDDIWVIDTNDGTARKLTDSEVKESDPAWSPDGSLIAYSRGREIWVMTAAG